MGRRWMTFAVVALFFAVISIVSSEPKLDEQAELEEWLALEERVDSLLELVDELEVLVEESDICSPSPSPSASPSSSSSASSKRQRAMPQKNDFEDKPSSDEKTAFFPTERASLKANNPPSKRENSPSQPEKPSEKTFEKDSSKADERSEKASEKRKAGSVLPPDNRDYSSFYDSIAKQRREEKKRKNKLSENRATLPEKRFGLRPRLYCKACAAAAHEVADAIARATALTGDGEREEIGRYEMLDYEGNKKKVLHTEMVLEGVLDNFCAGKLKNYVPVNTSGERPTQAEYNLDDADDYAKATYDLYDTTAGFGGLEHQLGFSQLQVRQGYLSNLAKLQKGLMLTCERLLEEYDEAIAAWYFGGGAGVKGPTERARRDLEAFLCCHEDRREGEGRELKKALPLQVPSCSTVGCPP